MRKINSINSIISLILFCALFCFAATVTTRAQNVKNGPDTSSIRDPGLEKESRHSLEVARHYFRLKKAYRAAIARCEEIIAGNPTFSQLDEVLYLAGASSLRLSENRGKQTATLPADKLRDDAREYFSRIVNEFPDSSFRERALMELRPLGGVKPKDAKASVSSQ